MEKTIIKKTFTLGEVAYKGDRKPYTATVDLELRDVGHGTELSICGWVADRTGYIVSGGQIIDEIKEYFPDDKTVARIYNLWKNYHLNGMRMGTERQEKALKAAGIRDYDEACAYLRGMGIYVDTLADNEHLSCETETASRNHYEYGHGWILREIPAKAMSEIYNLCGVENTAAVA